MATLSISSRHHVKLNGVAYRLAEDAEGDHYVYNGEPLRPPNAVVVQGTARQDKFQTRSDLVMWSISDWSGGEGQAWFAPGAPNRHAVLYDVDPFDRPGTLMPGYAIEDTVETGPVTLTVKPLIVKYSSVAPPSNGVSALIVLDAAVAGDWWKWNNGSDIWEAQTDYTGPSSAPQSADADEDYVYMHETGTTKIWKFAHAGGAASAVATSGISSDAKATLVELGDYLYQIDWGGFTVYEVIKTASSGAGSALDTASPALNSTGGNFDALITKGPNRLYIALPSQTGDTTIREIVPTSAAGTGYGVEIARFSSFVATSMWFHQGTLFVGGHRDWYSPKERILLYYTPGGEYGAIGRPRTPSEEAIQCSVLGSSEGNALDASTFLLHDNSLGGSVSPRVFELDSVTGGYAQIASVSDSGSHGGWPVRHHDAIFFSKDHGTASGGVYRVNKEAFASTGYAITPWHDMGLSDEKVLSSVILSCEALPANWEIILSYAVNGSASFTTAGTYSTTGGTGTRYQISTQGAGTKAFRSMRLKIAFNYTGGGTPSTRPVVTGVDVRAQLANPVRTWQLMLDLSDDHGNVGALSGKDKIAAIKEAATTGLVVRFNDEYYHRLVSGTPTDYDVVVDSYKIIQSHAGEGIAYIVLREIA